MEEQMKNDKQMDTWARNIFSATLFTEDLGKSKQFHEQVFGLSLVFGAFILTS